MIKQCTEKPSFKKQPKEETIQFLLNYSKSLKIINRDSKRNFELYLN